MKVSMTTATACVGLLLSCSLATAADTLKEAVTEGTLKGEVRTYYFSRDFDGDTQDRQDLALGTLLYYRTAPLKGVSVGLATATSSDLGSDDDKAVYGLLARDDDGSHKDYARLQEYYLQGDWFDTKIKLGAQEVNNPLLSRHDIRMSPRTYRGLTVENNSIENLTITGDYITDYMLWYDDSFRNMGDIAGTDAEDEPFMAAGLKYNMSLGSMDETTGHVWYYYMPDYFSLALVKADLIKKFDGFKLHFFPSFLKQDSIGDDLAGEFDTYQYGFKTRLNWEGFRLTGYYSKTGDNNLLTPWGGGKIIIQQVLYSNRAEENSYGLKLFYDFGEVGIPGLSAYVFPVYYDAPDSGENAASDVSEIDFNIQYAFSGALDGLSLRGRYAMIDFDDDSEADFDDFRIYLKYTFALKGK